MSGDARTNVRAVYRHDARTTRPEDADFLYVRRPPLGPELAFIAAYPRMAEFARHVPGRGFVGVAVDPQGGVVGSVILRDSERVIVGRHSECGLVLEYPTVSLRHVAAFLHYDASGPMLRVWDLASDTPFVTESGVSERAVVATGPLYFALDRFALWFVPVGGGPGAWPPSAEAAFRALPRRSFLRSEERPEPEPESESDPYAGTYVGSLPPALGLGGADPAAAVGFLTLDTLKGRKHVALSAEDLEHGVLLGRYSRCDIHSITEHTVSRVHALLVRIAGREWVLDVASSNGTWRHEARITTHALEARDRLRLSGALEISWRRY
jgi:hypothetical protein